MKNVKVIGCGFLVMGMLLLGMPAKAQTMEWQSTSTMQGSGTYTAPITEVGATSAASSYSPAQAPSGPRKAPTPINDQTDMDRVGEGLNTPLGDALIPLMLCACAYLIIRARKRANKGERANG